MDVMPACRQAGFFGGGGLMTSPDTPSRIGVLWGMESAPSEPPQSGLSFLAQVMPYIPHFQICYNFAEYNWQSEIEISKETGILEEFC